MLLYSIALYFITYSGIVWHLIYVLCVQDESFRSTDDDHCAPYTAPLHSVSNVCCRVHSTRYTAGAGCTASLYSRYGRFRVHCITVLETRPVQGALHHCTRDTADAGCTASVHSRPGHYRVHCTTAPEHCTTALEHCTTAVHTDLALWLVDVDPLLYTDLALWLVDVDPLLYTYLALWLVDVKMFLTSSDHVWHVLKC